ncbi:MAG: dockerin type I repeat-containing protein [Muribaculaceae bacterium]|nr:dockerin type I repeat-containing protein [Muribaculaceae bacterium]
MKKLLLSAFALAVAISASAFNLTNVNASIKAPSFKVDNQQMTSQFKGLKTQPTTPLRVSEEDLVTVPDGVTIETDWTINGTYNTSQGGNSIEEATSVAFDGNDVYIQGLAYYFPDAWVKGTISGTTATFPCQYVGTDEYGDEYLAGYASSNLSSFSFIYDSENNTFTLNGLLIENNGNTSVSAWGYYSSLIVAKGEIVKPDPVVAPEGLETLDAVFVAYACEDIDDEGNITWADDMTQLELKIGADGDVIYIQGLCTYLPEAWVIASFNEDGQLVIPTGQYFGAYEGNDIYLLGYGENGIEDIVFTLDEENGYYTCDQFTILSSSATTIIWWEIYSSSIFAIIAPENNVYILGQVNGNDWAANVGYAMTTEDGVTYTADITCAPVDEGDTDGYSFFSFTTKLADDADGWDAIAGYRFGAVSEGDFLVTDDMIGIELGLTDENGQAYKIPDGEYGLSLNLETMKLVITKKTAPGIVGDVTGEGDVDVSDVNAVINIILNKATQADYPGNADITGEGDIDVSDVNAIINIILGKN